MGCLCRTNQKQNPAFICMGMCLNDVKPTKNGWELCTQHFYHGCLTVTYQSSCLHPTRRTSSQNPAFIGIACVTKWQHKFHDKGWKFSEHFYQGCLRIPCQPYHIYGCNKLLIVMVYSNIITQIVTYVTGTFNTM